jgi:molybdopterin-containing oxidoreductase family iron-sulfur binding subunit
VVAGEYQPPWVQALVHAINAKIGAIGQTLVYAAPLSESSQSQIDSLTGLVEDIEAGGNRVETLLILESNPAFNAPANLNFARVLEQVPVSVHFGSLINETTALCTWHVPAAHFLESWSDVRAFDGTVSLIQPLLAPMYNAKGIHELINVVLDQPQKSAYETVREMWKERQGADGFEPFWQKALHDGLIPVSQPPVIEPVLKADLAQEINRLMDEATSTSNQELTVVFRPHPTLWDGRFANNGWLEELPQPFTKLTWGNAALISPTTAQEHGLEDGDVIELSQDDRRIQIPVVIVPGQANDVITLHLGCGQKLAGRVGADVGTDVFPLRTTEAMWSLGNVVPSKTGEQKQLPRTQHHFLIEGRGLVRHGSYEEYQEHPEHPAFMESGHHAPTDASFYPDLLEGSPQWGMAINLGACIGCSACVLACQAENNIPIVGPAEVARGREMHWLRIDTYYEGEPGRPQAFHQPVMCMHCEHAPCEPVCPVAATTHSSDGLNEMTYNRCIGTRYCSNNCPYKVRRFNYFDYQESARELPVLALLQNPEVTVRSRGVMEKCTYCVQRISKARIQAGLENREIEEDEVATACQAVCPTRAIVFGDISRNESQVSKEKASPLNYSLLEELNTRPRTTYLAAVRNPHPDL